jgi:hypothetical protein
MRKISCFSLLLVLLNGSLWAADPWFTGPLLANAGQTIQKNKFNFQPYGFYIVNELNNPQPIRHPRTASTISQINDVVTLQGALGITDALDAQVDANFLHNIQEGRHFTGVGDTNLMMGYQLINQNNNPNKPNIRFTVQQTIPTGRFSNLSPVANGTDSTGLGSNQTNFGLNFSQVNEVYLGHYLQTTLNLNYLYAPPVKIDHASAYGGNEHTRGRIYPGNLMSLDFALELTLTQHWVAVIETFSAYRLRTRFIDYGTHPLRFERKLGNAPINEITLAPALEYNFSANFGVIGGVWFNVGGKNSPVFRASVLSFTYTF